MKKESLIYVFRLLLLGLVLFVSAFQKGAANPLDNRWQPLSYQDGVGIFFDTATIRFTDGNEGQIRFWQRCALDAAAANEFSDLLSGYDEKLQVSYFLEDCIIDIGNHTKKICEVAAYDANHMLLETNRPTTQDWRTILPDSAGEKVYFAITAYANTHRQQLLDNESSNRQQRNIVK